MAHYGLTPADYDGLTLEFLNVLVSDLNQNRED